MENYQERPIKQLIEQLEMAGKHPNQALLVAILARQEEAAPLLLQIFDQSIADEWEDNDWEDDDPRWYRLAHSGNFLRYWKEPKALPIFVRLYDKYDDWCEWYEEDLYEYGEVAIEPFGEFVLRTDDEGDPKEWRYGRALATGILSKIGLKFPDTRDRIVQILSSVLPPLEAIPALTQDDYKAIWTEVVDGLGDLQHEESRAQIMALFEANLIDRSMNGLDWYKRRMAEEIPQPLKNLKPYDLLKDYKSSYEKHLIWKEHKEARQRKERTHKHLAKRVQMQQGHKVIEKAVKIGRNDPCPCGSGKKYKKCCKTK